MTITTHTPTPWQMLRRDSGWDITATMRKGYTKEIAVVLSRGDEVQQANAAHIVRCVNAHDEMVAALRKIADGDTDAENAFESACQFAEIARAALAKVSQS